MGLDWYINYGAEMHLVVVALVFGYGASPLDWVVFLLHHHRINGIEARESGRER